MSKYRVSKTDPLTREAIRRNTAAVLPDRPSAIGMKPHEIRAALCRAIISENGKGSLMDELDRIVDEINIALSDDHLQIERITVPVTEWTDGAPYQAYMWLPVLGGIDDSESTKTYAALLIPMNEATRAAAQETELVIDATYAFAGGSIQALLKRQNAIPEVPLEFTVVAFAMENETGEPFKATAAFVGVSALPEGLKRDVDALRDLITVSGSVTLPVSTWSDGTPHENMTFIEGFGAGMTALLYPADEESERVAVEAGLSARPTVTEVGEEGVVWLIRAEAGTVPTVPITLDYVMVKTGSDAAPKAVLLGVDAVGGGEAGDSIDAAGAEAIVKRLVPEWARASEPPEETDPSVSSWAKEQTKPTYTKNEVGLGNVDNVRQYSESNPPPYPVSSVNGQTGAVAITVPSKASDIGAEVAGTAAFLISEHNADDSAHNDIRLLIKAHQDEVNALLNSDDETLNETKEIVAYIKSNKSLIDAITTSKVNVKDVVNNLETNDSQKPLSAAQGVVLKTITQGIQLELSDVPQEIERQIEAALTNYITAAVIANTYQPIGDYLTAEAGDERYAKPTDLPTKTSQLTNDSNYAVTTKAETWTFTLKDGSTVTKKVVLA